MRNQESDKIVIDDAEEVGEGILQQRGVITDWWQTVGRIERARKLSEMGRKIFGTK